VAGVAVLATYPWASAAQNPPVPTGGAPAVRLNRVIEKLQQGGTVVGTFPGRGTDLAQARAISTSDNDFVMFDLQYGLFDVAELQTALLGMVDKGAVLKKGNLQPNVVPLCRIPVAAHENPQFVVTQLLDIGFFGIMFPDIETREQAANAIATMRYPKRNTVGVGGPSATSRPLAAAWFWGLPEAEYMRRADTWPQNPGGELLPILQIESDLGIKNADQILEVPGVGVIFLGPGDLSRSLGEKGMKAPKTEAGVQTVLEKCIEKRVACGYPIVEATPELAKRELERRRAEGFKMLTVSVSGR
jgi:4-hydroxy-2-oxoheptanedioate aldolase